MRTLTVTIDSDPRFFGREREAAERIDAGEGYQGEHYSFETLPLLFEVFSQKRWELITKLQSIGPSSLRALARALGRDVKRVHEDAAILLEEGIIERDEKNKLVVPFKTIHIDVKLEEESVAA
jgi:predicted transcriptional regulator